MYYGPYLDIVNLRERRLLEKNVIRLSKIQSDIVFLSRCKKFDIIPKGLRLKNPFKFQSNSLCIKGNYTCEKAERILRNTAINDAYRKQRLLEKEINTSRTILQREYPLEYEETADFINKQFERHKEMFFERKMKNFTAFVISTRYSMPIASTNKLIFWKLKLMLPICQITNSPKNISSYWNMAYLFVRQGSISIE